MSSGLASNNAFTTTLVLRTYGFLREHGLLSSAIEDRKHWQFAMFQNDAVALGKELKKSGTEAAKFLYQSLSEKTLRLVDAVEDSTDTNYESKLNASLGTDLRLIAQGSWIYSKSRFPNVPDEILAVKGQITPYRRAETNYAVLTNEFSTQIKSAPALTLAEIAVEMTKDKSNFRINDYPPAIAVMYWFVDGVDRAEIALTSEGWNNFCKWATEEFNHQRSLVLAQHEVTMDPIALGMAACLCSRLQKISRANGMAGKLPTLPSPIELEHSILEIFKHQTAAGVWPKYFPMFHYQEAGANFCFTFEFLEAIVKEFGSGENHLMDEPLYIEGLEKAISWCEGNRYRYPEGGTTYQGWNSGGELESLYGSKPESWATAVVHMFAWELRDTLSQAIQRHIIKKYDGSDLPERPDTAKLDGLLDVDVMLSTGAVGLKQALKEQLISVNAGKNEMAVRHNGISKPLSALLFGPPGTSKTGIAEAVALGLGWPLIVINPSQFVRSGMEKVYLQADEIFKDLSDLAAVVIFFDEMDALVQNREKGQLDTPTQFLITSMLPQLATLHNAGRVVFLMATNHQSKFDPAIKRAGRFDLLLCVGPPKLSEKLGHLSAFIQPDVIEQSEQDEIRQEFEKLLKNKERERFQLELLTFSDFKEFLKSLQGTEGLLKTLRAFDENSFANEVRRFSKYATLRLGDLDEAVVIQTVNKVALSAEQVGALKGLTHPIAEYLLDRTESRYQF